MVHWVSHWYYRHGNLNNTRYFVCLEDLLTLQVYFYCRDQMIFQIRVEKSSLGEVYTACPQFPTLTLLQHLFWHQRHLLSEKMVTLLSYLHHGLSIKHVILPPFSRQKEAKFQGKKKNEPVLTTVPFVTKISFMHLNTLDCN